MPARRRLPRWVWGLLAASLLGAWWPLLDADVRAAALPPPGRVSLDDWAAIEAALRTSERADDGTDDGADAGEGADATRAAGGRAAPAARLFVLAGDSAEYVRLRWLAYPRRLARLPAGLAPGDLARRLPAERVRLLLLHVGDAPGVLQRLAARAAPRTPRVLARIGAHLLVELAP